MKKNPLFCFAATALLGFALVSCGEPSAGDVSSSENEVSSSESIVTKYLVTFDINGGKLPTGISEIPTQEVEEGHWATKPLVEPYKEHATFDGWYTRDGFAFNFMTQIYGNVDLVAHYTVQEDMKVTLTFDPANGQTPYTVDTFIGDVIETAVPKKDGYVFKGWYYGEGNRFTGYVSEEVAAAKTLTADYGKQDFNYYYEINNDESVTITGIRDVESVIVTFPSSIDGRPVTRIGKNALQSRVYVEEVTIPASVREIEPGFSSGARRIAAYYVEAGNPSYVAVDGVLYSKDKTVLVRVPAKGYAGASFTVPAGVKRIEYGAFIDQKDEGMTDVSLPEGLEEIGGRAFYDWRGWSTLKLPSTLKKIGDYAFCAFDTANKVQIVWNEGLEEIGESAFFGQYVHDILVLPKGLKRLGTHAFATTDGKNAITDVVLPASLEAFEGGVFSNDYGIASIRIDGESAFYEVVDNILYTKDGKKVVYVPSDHKGTIAIKEGVEEIGAYAMGEIRYYDALSFPSTLKKIGENAFFYNHMLTSIEIPDSVVEIGESAFDSCDRLSSVTLGSGVTSIGRYAFADIAASQIEIPGNVKTIGENAFFGTRFKNITFAEGLEEIGDGAFYFLTSSHDDDYGSTYSSSLTSLSFPSSLKRIGGRAFANHESLSSIRFGAGIEEIGPEAFAGAKPTSLSVETGGKLAVKDLSLYSSDFSTLFYVSPAKTGDFAMDGRVTKVAPYAAVHIPFTGISFSPALEEIGEGAFMNCFDSASGITLSFPSSLRSIGEGAFYMTKVDAVDFSQATSLETIGVSAFEMSYGTGTLSFPSSLRSIGEDAFYAAEVTGVSFAEGLLSIGDRAFFGNRNLGGEVVLPASLSSLGDAIFGSWGTNTAMGNEISSLSVAAGSTHFVSQDNVVYDASKETAYAIAGLANGKIALPSTLKTIRPFGFADATKVTGFTLPEGLESIGDYAFSNDVSVLKMDIPSSVTFLGERAFSSWGVAQKVVLPWSLDYCNSHFMSGWKDNSRAEFVYAE